MHSSMYEIVIHTNYRRSCMVGPYGKEFNLAMKTSTKMFIFWCVFAAVMKHSQLSKKIKVEIRI